MVNYCHLFCWNVLCLRRWCCCFYWNAGLRRLETLELELVQYRRLGIGNKTTLQIRARWWVIRWTVQIIPGDWVCFATSWAIACVKQVNSWNKHILMSSTQSWRAVRGRHTTKCGAGRICGTDLNGDNLWISMAYLRISDHCRVRDSIRVRVWVGVRIKVRVKVRFRAVVKVRGLRGSAPCSDLTPLQ